MSWIMVAGPYRAGAAGEENRARNLRALNEAALAVFAKGHVPVIGANMALPMIEAAGAERYDELMMPVSLALAERCDAILRIGGPSGGADREVALMRQRGKPVYARLSDIPEAPK
ncbi:MAG: hypothetical protein AAGI70_09475 [Pseudomonadota bacterium]